MIICGHLESGNELYRPRRWLMKYYIIMQIKQQRGKESVGVKKEE